MIELIGESGSPEYEAALLVRDALVRTWPGIEATPPEQDHVKIASRVKLSGQKVSDVDVIVVGLLATDRYVVPRANAKDTDGKSLVGSKVRVRSFVAAIEVKDHPAEKLRVEAGSVKVLYKGGWKDATSQNDDQRYALAGYLADSLGSKIWVYRCVLLRGINELPKHRGIPQPQAGTVPATFDGVTLLMAMASVNGLRRLDGTPSISSGSDATIQTLLSNALFAPLVPSSLDRRRMDRIAARPSEARELSRLLGHQRVHLRGNGGTGKTILLLQAAYDAFVDRGTRSIMLTYNTALTADIQRTLALMGIPSDGDAGGIRVRTSMSFIYSWLRRLGIAKEGAIDLEDYEAKCAEALRYFEDGALHANDIQAIKSSSPTELDFDAVLVDEAQDCPRAEAALLVQLYGARSISLADGLMQLVRGAYMDWSPTANERQQELSRSLREGLRMKAGLCRFANALAEQANLQWRVTPNQQAAGGQVIICDGRYLDLVDLQREMLASAIQAGNMPIDMLHCVPPSGVYVKDGMRHSFLATAFDQNSWASWDAVGDVPRRSFPRSPDSLRIVQYESCRGLEGWTVVLDGLDEFWDLKRSAAPPRHASSDGPDPYSEDVAAWRWCMIAVTRPIDTLVITVRDRDSVLGRTLATLAKALPDVVDYRAP